MSISVLYVGNDNIIEVDGLKNDLTGTDLNGATVTVTLKDAVGANVAGGSWPLAMPHVASSHGLYRATLGYGLSLVDGARYTAAITADGGSGLRANWSVECVARTRN